MRQVSGKVDQETAASHTKETTMDPIPLRFEMIRQRIRQAAAKSGRPESAVELVAVSKFHPAPLIEQAVACGQIVFGESRVQEAMEKIPQLPAELQWHFIGHLQKNKIRKALPLFQLLHGIDSVALAGEISRIAVEEHREVDLLLEVNVSGELSKFGLDPEGLEAAINEVGSLPSVRLSGLMTMAPYDPEPENARPYFARLRKLRDEVSLYTGIPLPHLSMGMSGDFEVAIEEGATLVRIGSSLFGERG